MMDLRRVWDSVRGTVFAHPALVADLSETSRFVVAHQSPFLAGHAGGLVTRRVTVADYVFVVDFGSAAHHGEEHPVLLGNFHNMVVARDVVASERDYDVDDQ